SAIIFVAVSVVIFLMIFVIPVFAQMFQDFGGTLPWPTQLVIGLSDFMKNYFLFAVPLFIVAVFGFKQYYRTESGKRSIHRTLLKVPIFGPLLQKAAIARFSRTLSTLMGSGVPIIDSLDITARTAGNKVLEEAVLASIGSIREGQTLATPLAKQPVFPPMVVQMVEIGDVTGELDSMLSKIADFFEEEVDRAVEALTAMLEPDFSVVRFRPNFMLVSEEHPMKTHKNQWLLNPPSPPEILWERRTKAHHMGPEVQTPLQRPDMEGPPGV
ncbi:MAG: type II secretion system F family protein, partial [Candidatus Tectomicrobia bacterium]|nr:type II secretion system F family protein [Candidatus Tectomicrobia bacterium]